MSDWKDPNLRNHINGDSTLTIGRFFEKFAFKSKTSSNKTYPYKLKDVYKTYDIIYNALDNEKFSKYSSRLKEISKEYENFAETSNGRPMKDSYYTYGKNVQLYQFLLIANSLWSSLEYNSDIGGVKVPSKNTLTNMLRDLLIGNNYRNMRELTSEEEIRDVIQRSIDAENEYTLTDVISEKMYMNEEDVNKRLKSPLMKYLTDELIKLSQDSSNYDEELLNEKLNDLFMRLRQYIKETESEVD